MQAKFHIDFTERVVSAEGDVDFVREVYSEVREHLEALGKEFDSAGGARISHGRKPKNIAKPKRTAQSKKLIRPPSGENGVDARHPKLDKTLDASQLVEFFQQFEPTNNPERILIFAKYLIDKLGIEQVNTDQIYTCFSFLKERIPPAFGQSFRDSHGRKYGFIEFLAPGHLKITTIGENHFNSGIKKRM